MKDIQSLQDLDYALRVRGAKLTIGWWTLSHHDGYYHLTLQDGDPNGQVLQTPSIEGALLHLLSAGAILEVPGELPEEQMQLYRTNYDRVTIETFLEWTRDRGEGVPQEYDEEKAMLDEYFQIDREKLQEEGPTK